MSERHIFWNDHRMEPTTVCMRCGVTYEQYAETGNADCRGAQR